MEARQDRIDVAEHIAADNPRAAAKFDQLFGDAAGKLADFPMLGHAGKVIGTRELIPHASYRLVYQVDEASDTVWILALVHTAREWPPVGEDQDRSER